MRNGAGGRGGVAPAGGFRDDCRVNPVDDRLIAGDVGRGSQSPAVEKHRLRPGVEQVDELAIVLQEVEWPAGVGPGGVALIGYICVQRGPAAVQRHLRVPREKLVSRAVGRVLSTGVIILVRPVVVSRKHVEQEIVHVIGHIQQDGIIGIAGAVRIVALQPLIVGIAQRHIGGRRRVVRVKETHQLVPHGRRAAVDGVARIDRFVVLLVAADVLGLECSVRPLRGVVESPVEPVDVEVNEVAVYRGLTHLQEALVHEQVTNILRAVVSPHPAVVEIRPQGNGVEGIGGAVSKEIVDQFGWAVRRLEDHAKRVLAELVIPTVAPLHSQRRVDLKTIVR